MWTIPAVRRKLKITQKANAELHLVPLPRQAIVILREIYLLTGANSYMFSLVKSNHTHR